MECDPHWLALGQFRWVNVHPINVTRKGDLFFVQVVSFCKPASLSGSNELKPASVDRRGEVDLRIPVVRVEEILPVTTVYSCSAITRETVGESENCKQQTSKSRHCWSVRDQVIRGSCTRPLSVSAICCISRSVRLLSTYTLQDIVS